MGISYNEKDDFKVKGDDGTSDGDLVSLLTDTAGVKRLAVSCCEKSGTSHFNGSVGTSALAVPPSAGADIQTIAIKNPRSNAFSKILMVSFDGGTTYWDLRRGDSLIWSFKDDLKQIYIRGSAAAVDYQIILNREAS